MDEPTACNRLVLIVEREQSVLLQPRGEVYALPCTDLDAGESFESTVGRLVATSNVPSVSDLRWHALLNEPLGLVVVLGCQAAPGGPPMFSWNALPPLDDESRAVLAACRASPNVLDRSGRPVAVGPVAKPVAPEPTTESLRPGGGAFAGFWAATLMLAGLLAWGLSVIVSLGDARLVDPGTLAVATLLALGAAVFVSVRHGFTAKAPSRGVAIGRVLVSFVVAVAMPLMLAALVGTMMGAVEPVAWFLTIVGAGMFLAVARTRPALRAESGVARTVRGLVWATLAFTTLWSLSSGLRRAMEQLHHTTPDAITAVDDE